MVINPNDFVHFKADAALVVDHFTRTVMNNHPSYSNIVCVFPEAGSCITEARVARGLLNVAGENRLHGKITHILLMDALFQWKKDSQHHDAALVEEPRISKFTSYHELCDTMERMIHDDPYMRFIVPGINMSNSCMEEGEYTGLERYFALCTDLYTHGIVLHGFLNYIYYPCIYWSTVNADSHELTVLENRLDREGYVVVVWQSGWRERWDDIRDRCRLGYQK